MCEQHYEAKKWPIIWRELQLMKMKVLLCHLKLNLHKRTKCYITDTEANITFIRLTITLSLCFITSDGHKVSLFDSRFMNKVHCRCIETGGQSKHFYVTKMLTWDRLLYLPNYLIPWSRVLLEKLTVAQLLKRFSPFYWTQKFFNVFKRSRYGPLPWYRRIQPTSAQSVRLSYILILSFHLRMGLPSSVFPSDFLTKMLCALLISPVCATCSAYLILVDLIILVIFGEQYKL
jgi:hypothetical protein